MLPRLKCSLFVKKSLKRGLPWQSSVKTTYLHFRIKPALIPGWGTKILHAMWHGQKIIIIINKNMGRNNAYKVKLSDYYQVVLMPAEKSREMEGH